MKNLNLICCMLLLFSTVQASDLAKEQRWREQVVDDLFDGEPLTLNDGRTDFLGLLIVADDPKPDAILVLHGVGVHPDWPQVINPLRVGLAEAGWTTLSIQLPVLANEAAPEDYNAIIGEASPRIAAALRFLHQQGAQGSYIVAHSMGSRMASRFLAQTDLPVKGFVGIGMNVGNLAYMNQYSLPMLDMYGSEDLEGVLNSATERAARAAGNPQYTQQEVSGADHFFDGMEEPLLQHVKDWLLAH